MVEIPFFSLFPLSRWGAFANISVRAQTLQLQYLPRSDLMVVDSLKGGVFLGPPFSTRQVPLWWKPASASHVDVEGRGPGDYPAFQRSRLPWRGSSLFSDFVASCVDQRGAVLLRRTAPVFLVR